MEYRGESKQSGEEDTGHLFEIASLKPSVDIIFFQEVSRSALRALLNEDYIQRYWISSERDANGWGLRPFTTMTLLSKVRFVPGSSTSQRPSVGGLTRIKYPSRYQRDALCSDIFLPPQAGVIETSPTVAAGIRVRLINVHLDSLALQPSCRPRQLAIISSAIISAGHGLVAGDFNPVLPEDEALVRQNGLIDIWEALKPGELGHTWGINGNGRFGPNRLDKVAVYGLKAKDIEVLHPPLVFGETPAELMPVSDHSGLRFSFLLGNSHWDISREEVN